MGCEIEWSKDTQPSSRWWQRLKQNRQKVESSSPQRDEFRQESLRKISTKKLTPPVERALSLLQAVAQNSEGSNAALAV